MDVEEFRKNGKEMIDWICDYYKNIGKYPVKSQEKPGYLKPLIPNKAPLEGEKWEDIMKDVNEKIVPGMTHWQSPNFFAYYPANSSYEGILGEMLSGCFNVIGFNWICSPACTELETIVLDWMADVQNLPECFRSSGTGGGVIQGSASDACLVAMIAARKKVEMENKVTCDSQEEEDDNIGKIHSKLVAYVSEHTHSSVQKGCMISGIQNLRVIPGNDDFEIDTEILEQKITEDEKNGNIPFFVCATIGTTSSSSNDDINKIGDICCSQRRNIWLHVDAAYAGSFMILPSYREKYLKGIEKCWSYNFNAHKMLLTNFDCSLLYVRDRIPLIYSLSISPEYLKSKEKEKNLVFDYRDWQIPLGRRFRALKLWFVMRKFGVNGLRKYVQERRDFALELEKDILKDERFEIVGKTIYSLVCFRLKLNDKSDEMNTELENLVNDDGRVFIVHTKLKGRIVLRFAIGSRLTKLENVKMGWKVIQEMAAKVLEKASKNEEEEE